MGFFQLFGTVIAQGLEVILGGSRLLHNQKNKRSKRQRKEISEFLWAQGGPCPSISHFTCNNNMQNGTFSIYIATIYDYNEYVQTRFNLINCSKSQYDNTNILHRQAIRKAKLCGWWLLSFLSGIEIWERRLRRGGETETKRKK